MARDSRQEQLKKSLEGSMRNYVDEMHSVDIYLDERYVRHMIALATGNSQIRWPTGRLERHIMMCLLRRATNLDIVSTDSFSDQTGIDKNRVMNPKRRLIDGVVALTSLDETSKSKEPGDEPWYMKSAKVVQLTFHKRETEVAAGVYHELTRYAQKHDLVSGLEEVFKKFESYEESVENLNSRPNYVFYGLMQAVGMEKFLSLLDLARHNYSEPTVNRRGRPEYWGHTIDEWDDIEVMCEGLLREGNLDDFEPEAGSIDKLTEQNLHKRSGLPKDVVNIGGVPLNTRYGSEGRKPGRS